MPCCSEARAVWHQTRGQARRCPLDFHEGNKTQFVLEDFSEGMYNFASALLRELHVCCLNPAEFHVSVSTSPELDGARSKRSLAL